MRSLCRGTYAIITVLVLGSLYGYFYAFTREYYGSVPKPRSTQRTLAGDTAPNSDALHSHFQTMMQRRQAVRKHRLEKVCAHHPELPKNISAMSKAELSRFAKDVFVDENNKVIFCFIPKAASHSVRSMVLNSTGRANISSKARFSPWRGGHLEDVGVYEIGRNSATPDDIAHKLNTYYTFLFSRHPLDRLVSAYHDKFQGREPKYRQTLAREIRETLTRHTVNDSDSQNLNISFNEFAEYSLLQPERKLDWHWQTFQTLCSPCVVNYDFIGTVETLESDARYLMRHKLTRRASNTIPHMHRKRGDADLQENSVSSPNGRPLPDLSQLGEETFQKLLQRYGTDMEMFGYTFAREQPPSKVIVNASCETPACDMFRGE